MNRGAGSQLHKFSASSKVNHFAPLAGKALSPSSSLFCLKDIHIVLNVVGGQAYSFCGFDSVNKFEFLEPIEIILDDFELIFREGLLHFFTVLRHGHWLLLGYESAGGKIAALLICEGCL